MITTDDALLAKEALKAQLGTPPWLRGIGIGKQAGVYCVKVNVDTVTPTVLAALPSKVQEVPVFVEAVGDLTPLAMLAKLGKNEPE